MICAPLGHNIECLQPCTHEEADTRLVLHLADAAENGYKRIVVRTADTDVVVILVANILARHVDEVWVAFGVGKHFRYIAIHEIVFSLGPEKSKALTMFHALT